MAVGAAGGGSGGSSPPRGGGGPSFPHSWGPTQTRGEDDLKHTCDCPRCMVPYETCIQSLMAHVQDLRAQNLQLQRSQQELSQAVASTYGISQSYGEQMTQVLSTLAKFDAVVQGYQRGSRVLAASVADNLKMTNRSTAKCFSAVETLATRYAAVASRIAPLGPLVRHACEACYAGPAPAIGASTCFLILSRRHLRRPWARHLVHPVVVVSFLSPSTHPTTASTIRTHVQTRSGRGEKRNTMNTPITSNPLLGGEPPKNRRNLLSPSGRRYLRARNTPRSLRSHGRVRRTTPLHWGTSIPSRKMFSLPPGNLHTRPLILRTRVQSLQ